MTAYLRTRPAATPAMLAVFSDEATLAHALAFERALAQAQAAEGVISAAAAEAIAQACRAFQFDVEGLGDEAALAGTLAIPVVARLRASLPAGEAAAALHRGATSQDVADTVMMLQAQRGAALLQADASRIDVGLADLAMRHAQTPAIGRTLLQDALPISFGLRIAHWRAGIADAARRLQSDVTEHAALQLGGAAGTRAGMEGKGAAVAARMAAALDLRDGPPWHGRRNGSAAIASSLGMFIGALAKMARDVSLLAQNAIGEAREPLTAGRGGSSAMAHKRNPTASQIALTAGVRAPGLVAGVLAGMAVEEERGLGGWQAEGPALADLFLLAAGAAEAMAGVAEGLEVDDAAIARNLAAAGVGEDIGESAAITAALLEQKRRD
ncbi:MAG: lyase family protein [Hyphomonadaceae bacterium]